MGDEVMHTGSCLCGGVRYEVRGALRDVVACHCSQCRKTSGHFVAMTNAPTTAIAFSAADSLTWYRSSESAERGFCKRCGGNLFWRELEGETISIAAGTLDPPTRLRIERHIFVADKADYYEITDGAPRQDQG